PTYYVFKMYVPHQGARVIPCHIESKTMSAENERSGKPRTFQTVSATASEKDGVVTISLTNVDLTNDCEVTVKLGNLTKKNISGEILTSKNIADYNDFGKAELVAPAPFKGAKISGNTLTVKMPAKSIVSLTLK
ncbi:MAG: alpha-N-arabinofuranosidase, partial [Muribaculaceae bacterium]|nr:alpha-N-arabinofuranosidase [Muribaculaceae bacterium]